MTKNNQSMINTDHNDRILQQIFFKKSKQVRKNKASEKTVCIIYIYFKIHKHTYLWDAFLLRKGRVEKGDLKTSYFYFQKSFTRFPNVNNNKVSLDWQIAWVICKQSLVNILYPLSVLFYRDCQLTRKNK